MVSKSFILAAAGAATVQAGCTFPYAQQLPANAISKPSGSDTPTIGVPFSVTYDGTKLGPILSFKLLRGPGENIIEIGSIADGISNCGTASCTWTWTPDSSLQPDTTHYGIKMVDETSCNYQYTTQFGLNAGTSKPPPKSSSAAIPKPSESGKPMPKPSSSVAPPKPSASSYAPPKPYPSAKADDEDCEEGTDGHPSPSGYKASAPSAGAYTPPAAGWKASNGTGYATNSSDGAAPTYQPLQSNDGARFAISAFGAIVAFAAAIMVL